jgi:UDP-N-acetylglucosamine 4-epimerase
VAEIIFKTRFIPVAMSDLSYHNGSLSGHSFLVTGGAGFIGSNLVEYLIRHRAGKVRVLDNLSTGHLENIKAFEDYPGFEWMEGDIRDLETCRRACAGIRFVSHQAALGSVPRSVKDPVTTNSVNIDGFLNMLQAAREAGSVEKMVYAASSSTYGDKKGLPKVEDQIGNPLSPYAVTKLVNELYAGVFSRLYGFHTIGLRYFNVFGPRQDPDGPYAAVIPLFMRACLEGNAPVIFGDGEQTRDFTFVDNAVQANVRAMLTGPALDRHEVVNIACGQNISLNGLWTELSMLAGVHTTPQYKTARQGDVRDSLADIGKARGLLGYDPRIDVRQGLKLTYTWYKNKR